MPTTERLIRDCGGHIHLDPQWRWSKQRKLTPEEASEVIAAPHDTATIEALAKKFDMAPGSIRNIQNGYKYRHLRKAALDKENETAM